MAKEKDASEKRENKFEWVLYMNDNPIIKRYINADDYNPKVRYSVDIRHMADEIAERIQEELKRKCVNTQWEEYENTKIQKNLWYNRLRKKP